MELLENSILWCAIGATLAGLAAAGIDRFKRPVATSLALLAAVGPWVHRGFESGTFGDGGWTAIVVTLVLPPLLFVASWSRYDKRDQMPYRRGLMAASYAGIFLSSVYALAWAPILVLRVLDKVAG